MGVSNPATSATMSNELEESEYGVMSAAQLLATQVGEVAGIQAVLTIQESIARRSGLGTCTTARRCSTASASPFWVGAGAAAAGGGLRALHPIHAAAGPAHGATAGRRRLRPGAVRR